MDAQTIEVREILPDDMKVNFDGIVEQKILGASNHIRMIGEMIEAVARRGVKEKESIDAIVEKVNLLAQFFIQTRGEASQAVSNAIYLMIRGIDAYKNLSVEEGVRKIIDAKNRYQVASKEALDKIIAYSRQLGSDMRTLFVFDYSSTIERFLVELSNDGIKRKIYIAESRVIDGGEPFVAACQKSNYDIHFIPDAAIMYYLKECDAAFMGAETFFADGTGFNTIGSDLVGLVCKNYKVPLYFLTTLIKLDFRPTFGKMKKLVFNDIKSKALDNWDPKGVEIDKIDFSTPELVGVRSEYIEAFVTEKGIIPSAQMYPVSLEYYQYLRGDECDV